MRYTSPSGYDFEIPVEWLREAGVRGLRLKGRCYPRGKSEGGVKGKAAELPMEDIIASLDNRPEFGQPGPFDHRRMVSVLQALRDGVPLPPVWVWPIEKLTITGLTSFATGIIASMHPWRSV